jgi:hypothetical protein
VPSDGPRASGQRLGAEVADNRATAANRSKTWANHGTGSCQCASTKAAYPRTHAQPETMKRREAIGPSLAMGGERWYACGVASSTPLPIPVWECATTGGPNCLTSSGHSLLAKWSHAPRKDARSAVDLATNPNDRPTDLVRTKNRWAASPYFYTAQRLRSGTPFLGKKESMFWRQFPRLIQPLLDDHARPAHAPQQRQRLRNSAAPPEPPDCLIANS